MTKPKRIPTVHMEPMGETAVFVEFGKDIQPENHHNIKMFTDYLDKHPFSGMEEYVAAFCSVVVYYDPLLVKKSIEAGLLPAKQATIYQVVAGLLQKALSCLEASEDAMPRLVTIPVCYGGDFGPDLSYVASHNGLTTEEVIRIHTEREYLVYMIGFAPGFPYMGGMSEAIATPRRESPRLVIPAGAVGIAGKQTGMYPISTPGGWQLIGQTPLALFQPDKMPPTLLQAGDKVKFQPISPNEYAAYKEGNV